MTVQENVTYTGDTIHHSQVYTTDGTKNLFDGYKIALQPGSEILTEITSGSGGEVGMHITICEVSLE